MNKPRRQLLKTGRKSKQTPLALAAKPGRTPLGPPDVDALTKKELAIWRREARLGKSVLRASNRTLFTMYVKMLAQYESGRTGRKFATELRSLASSLGLDNQIHIPKPKPVPRLTPVDEAEKLMLAKLDAFAKRDVNRLNELHRLIPWGPAPIPEEVHFNGVSLDGPFFPGGFKDTSWNRDQWKQAQEILPQLMAEAEKRGIELPWKQFVEGQAYDQNDG